MTDNENRLKFEQQKKSKGIAYLLLIFLGYLGLHRFYAGRKITGAIQLLLTIGFIGGLTSGEPEKASMIMMINSIWLFVDLFILSKIIRLKNIEIAKKLGIKLSDFNISI